MTIGRSLALALLTATLAGCGSPSPQTPMPAANAPPPAPVPERDPHSGARPDEARVTHVALDLAADFRARTLSGTATLDLQVASGGRRVVLDTRDLTIRQVTDAAKQPLAYALGTADPILGRSLTVDLPAGTTRIVVDYVTAPGAPALQWLAPAQTAGKRHPYLFSQGQAILTRSWIPTQDSPGIRQTYEARITVPAPLVAVMSAERLTPAGVDVEASRRRFDFRLSHPIPPYLIAIAVGDIAFTAIGPRTGVLSEPAVLAAAAHEFADLERMVEAAERLYGPYRWGRYDLLILPPSFPYGGMENPTLTFATPTILAGDRSLTSLVAHELAHSWSGNLVTNATWNDFWLNEGFTVYFELRIMEALYGPERMAMLEALGRRELAEEIARLGPTSPDTRLHLDLAGRDPDEGTTAIAYEKGAAFLRRIEQVVGRAPLDAWLRSWFDRRAFTSATTADFVADLRASLIKGDQALEQAIALDRWITQPGLPDSATRPEARAFTVVETEVARFVAGTPAASLATTGWVTQQWQHFLGALPAALTTRQIRDLDRRFRFSASGNSEVLFAWLRIGIRFHYAPAMPALERFLTSQGRRKFLRPLYEDLMATTWGTAEARRIYAAARPAYHAVATSTLDAIVK